MLNDDIKYIEKWAHQWKMQFNPGKNKHAIQVIFSHKKSSIHPSLIFKGSEVVTIDEQNAKVFKILFYSRLSFFRHIKTRKEVGIIRFV